MKNQTIRCAKCRVTRKICQKEDGTGPSFCPTLNENQVISEALRTYEDPHIREFARRASIQEGECYANRGSRKKSYISPVKTRVQEVCEFAAKMNYKKLGIAFCSGLQEEASLLQDILEKQGFYVISVICKVGRVPKEQLHIKEQEKINPGQFESMCSPIAQAYLLNAKGTDFNIVVGLCVGHDSLFLKHSEAPCTVLVVKDRVLGHNPVAALYTSAGYYRKLSQVKLGKGGAVRQAMISEDG